MEARDASPPRSLQYEEFGRLYRKAQLAFRDLGSDSGRRSAGLFSKLWPDTRGIRPISVSTC
jgi:hypothetical protein